MRSCSEGTVNAAQIPSHQADQGNQREQHHPSASFDGPLGSPIHGPAGLATNAMPGARTPFRFPTMNAGTEKPRRRNSRTSDLPRADGGSASKHRADNNQPAGEVPGAVLSPHVVSRGGGYSAFSGSELRAYFHSSCPVRSSARRGPFNLCVLFEQPDRDPAPERDPPPLESATSGNFRGGPGRVEPPRTIRD